MQLLFMNNYFYKRKSMFVITSICLPIQARKRVKQSIETIIRDTRPEYEQKNILLWDDVNFENINTYVKILSYFNKENDIKFSTSVIMKSSSRKIAEYYFRAIKAVYDKSEDKEFRVYIPYNNSNVLEILRNKIAKAKLNCHVEYIKNEESRIQQFAGVFSGAYGYQNIDEGYFQHIGETAKAQFVENYLSMKKAKNKFSVYFK